MDGKPLAGRKILITRARDQSAKFATQLRDLGAEVIEFPTIEIVPPLKWSGLDHAIDQLKSYNWIILYSQVIRFPIQIPANRTICSIY